MCVCCGACAARGDEKLEMGNEKLWCAAVRHGFHLIRLRLYRRHLPLEGKAVWRRVCCAEL